MEFDKFVRICAERGHYVSFRRDGAVLYGYVRNVKGQMVHAGSFLIPGNLTDLHGCVLEWAKNQTVVRFDLQFNDATSIVTEYDYESGLTLNETDDLLFTVYDQFCADVLAPEEFGRWTAESVELSEFGRLS